MFSLQLSVLLAACSPCGHSIHGIQKHSYEQEVLVLFNPYTAARRFRLVPFTASDYYIHHPSYTPFTATDNFTRHVCDFSF